MTTTEISREQSNEKMFNIYWSNIAKAVDRVKNPDGNGERLTEAILKLEDSARIAQKYFSDKEKEKFAASMACDIAIMKAEGHKARDYKSETSPAIFVLEDAARTAKEHAAEQKATKAATLAFDLRIEEGKRQKALANPSLAIFHFKNAERLADEFELGEEKKKMANALRFQFFLVKEKR